ncbi:hypothetical protein BSZ39_09730 [Bowdeniella nasicola]|uniref:HTH merR-type domain-containing protein n=1 Tax=Bowdeniella nasicola TaxID=208480 RepID=A0A1Q5Q134_9ACTO|nr:helix-turn-helix transcriptional regulator [Bowdeniella nasicola]OKL53402.1 hypothetical protein BSZ39_09730 [Bowdeniella nasicola]
MARVDEPSFVISVAAELAGMHPQTLRQYDRLGLVTPSRTRGRGRRYSHEDIDALREIQRLSKDEGINLAGIREIIRLRDELRAAERELRRAARENSRLRDEADARRSHRVFTAGPTGDVVLVPLGMRLSGRGTKRDEGAFRAKPKRVLALPPARTTTLLP